MCIGSLAYERAGIPSCSKLQTAVLVMRYNPHNISNKFSVLLRVRSRAERTLMQRRLAHWRDEQVADQDELATRARS